MPIIFLVTVGLQVLCAVHVIRTGRPMMWLYLIVLLPLAGSAAYFLVEIMPDLRHSRAAKQAVRDVGAVIDPDRDFRELVDNLDRVESVENKLALAKECLRRERYDEARRLLESCLTGVHEDDPTLMLALARARFGTKDFAGTREILDRLREAHPDLRSPEGHMLYGRALEGQGNVERALFEYEALAGYFAGEEARCRYALLLQKTGRVDGAKAAFREVVKSVERASRTYFRSQRDWYEVARRNLEE
ncbi:MAG: tetratricopeptide repeat protein [Rhodospirillales bacterium]|nr:tetratricopeptide repeat protein [Rhodospirillales bacterium]MDH3792446.1 tetratricopeptide repeat protein [Rhodospirillales bacterium]MDH3910519.1 tetratricopeptide repeat protein [Rhodospirillales bacterium]MDH3920348.1 tetratricopeptide repeat protein [Rhodospirillales bacterium]MDH3966398.1 tetratricopeptide repeat protein [Rhodospirillales bacterium]